MFGHTGAAAYMWRLEGYQWESVLSFTIWILGIELRTSDLMAGSFTSRAISLASRFFVLKSLSWSYWFKSVILALRLRQEALQFKASLYYLLGISF